MPREIVHWYVLESTKDALRDAALEYTHSCLTNNRAAAYLGALAHDAPYYYRLGADPSFVAVAETLHGRFGNDTLKSFRDSTQAIAKHPDRDALWAFFVGMLSHYATDVIFHPMIFYFTGDYYDEDPRRQKHSRARHRLLEVYLDSWMRRQISTWCDHSLSRVHTAVGSSIEPITEILAHHYSILAESGLPCEDSSILQEKWKSSFNHLSELQKLFFSPVVGFVVRQLDALSLGLLRPYDALSSYGRLEVGDTFERALSFKNPLTGEETSATLQELLAQAAAETLSVLRAFEPHILDANATEELPRGKSLNVGRIIEEEPTLTHFSPTGLPLKGLAL